MPRVEFTFRLTLTVLSWLSLCPVACSFAPQSPVTTETTSEAGGDGADNLSTTESETSDTPRTCGPGRGQTLNLTRTAQLDELAGCSHFAGHLESFGGPENLDETSLIAALSQLEVIEGDLLLKNLEGIALLHFPRLRDVEGQLAISGIEHLTRMTAPNLERVQGELSLAFCPSIEQLELPALERCGGLSLTSLPRFVALSPPKLATIAGRLTLSRMHRLEMVELTSLGSLEQLHLETTNIPNLRRALPALQRVDDWIIIRANHAFDDAHGLKFVAELDHVGGEVTVYGNPAETTKPAPHRHPIRGASTGIETE